MDLSKTAGADDNRLCISSSSKQATGVGGACAVAIVEGIRRGDVRFAALYCRNRMGWDGKVQKSEQQTTTAPRDYVQNYQVKYQETVQ